MLFRLRKKRMMRALLVVCACALAGCAMPVGKSTTSDASEVRAIDDVAASELSQRVRAEVRRTWQDYRRYAWAHDDLAPLRKTGYDWYGKSLLMTPVDSLDTLILLGLEDRKSTR